MISLFRFAPVVVSGGVEGDWIWATCGGGVVEGTLTCLSYLSLEEILI